MLRQRSAPITGVLILCAVAIATPAHASSDFLSLAVLWSARLDSPVLASPVVDRTRVYLPVRTGRVTALALADGREVWSIDLPLTRGLALDGDLLFGVTANELIALDAATGTIRWRAAIGETQAAPAARGGWVLVGAGPDLLAFRGADGYLVWRQTLGAELTATVSIDGDRAYTPLADGTLAALEVTHGTVVWREKTPARPGAITVAGDRLFAGCADDFFYAFDARDGDRRWRWRAGADVLSPAAHDGERVYFTARDNVVRGVAFGSGVQKWRHAMETRPLAGPALDNDVVILAGTGELRMLAAKSGTLAGRWTSPAELAAPPAFVPRDGAGGARVVIVTGAATGDWRVYALARSPEPSPEPLKEIPGRTLSPEAPPALRGSLPPAAPPLP